MKGIYRLAVLGTLLVSCSSNGTETPSPGVTPPPGASEVASRLAASPRHAEWVVVKTSETDSVRAWLVYPERRDNAPVVVVVHEIYGLTSWVRSVADQLAADGFIAIAPELLTMKHVPTGANGDPLPDSARAAIQTLSFEEYQRDIRKTAEYAMNLPAATKEYGVVGYCWGGAAVFAHAIAYPDVGAVVSYYGTTPISNTALRSRVGAIRAPVLGLYGENDARVNATIAPMDSAMKSLGRTYEYRMFEGAGHGFLRQQDGANGANRQAAMAAWPLTVNWFRRYLEG